MYILYIAADDDLSTVFQIVVLLRILFVAL